jgi:3-oxoacyl-[acyl-carrier protein] reductase
MKLGGRIALVTGASRGIGRAIVLAFAEEGADVVVNYLQSESEAAAVVAKIKDMGRKAVAVKADISREKNVAAMVTRALETFGRIDILVNNTGILLPFSFNQPNYDNWQRMVDVNIKGMLLCSQAVAALMKQQGEGRIINIVIEEANGGFGYTLTKAAGGVVTRALARQLAPEILVNAIAPGCIDSGWISELSTEEQRALKEGILLKRWGQPEDVAKAAVFFASDDSSWITGTTLLVDGGHALPATKPTA